MSGTVKASAARKRTVAGLPVSASLFSTDAAEVSTNIAMGLGSTVLKLSSLCAMPWWSSICTAKSTAPVSSRTVKTRHVDTYHDIAIQQEGWCSMSQSLQQAHQAEMTRAGLTG